MLTPRFTAAQHKHPARSDIWHKQAVITFLPFHFLPVSCERSRFDPQTKVTAPVLALRYRYRELFSVAP